MQSFLVRVASRLLVVVGFFLAFSYCHSPSEPQPLQCVDQTVVLANDPEYIAKTEPLTTGPGHLMKNCAADARYCYYFGAAPIYTKGNQTVLDAYVEKDVVIVGKIVTAPSGGSSAGELWPGTICRLSR
jgi:hypothetical protein